MGKGPAGVRAIVRPGKMIKKHASKRTWLGGNPTNRHERRAAAKMQKKRGKQ